MDKPVFRNFNSREERIAAFRRMIHLREEWLEHVIQREKELGIYDEGYPVQDAC